MLEEDELPLPLLLGHAPWTVGPSAADPPAAAAPAAAAAAAAPPEAAAFEGGAAAAEEQGQKMKVVVMQEQRGIHWWRKRDQTYCTWEEQRVEQVLMEVVVVGERPLEHPREQEGAWKWPDGLFSTQASPTAHRETLLST